MFSIQLISPYHSPTHPHHIKLDMSPQLSRWQFTEASMHCLSLCICDTFKKSKKVTHWISVQVTDINSTWSEPTEKSPILDPTKKSTHSDLFISAFCCFFYNWNSIWFSSFTNRNCFSLSSFISTSIFKCNFSCSNITLLINLMSVLCPKSIKLPTQILAWALAVLWLDTTQTEITRFNFKSYPYTFSLQ